MSFDPVARQKADTAGTTAAQALVVAARADAAFALQTWDVVNSNMTAADGQHLAIDTTVQPVTITLPVGGGSVAMRDDTGTWDTHPVTVVGNGAQIAGQDTFVLDLPGYQVNFTRVGGAWRFTTAFLQGFAP